MLDIKKLRQEFDKISATISAQEAKDWLLEADRREAAEFAAEAAQEALAKELYLPQISTLSKEDYIGIIAVLSKSFEYFNQQKVEITTTSLNLSTDFTTKINNIFHSENKNLQTHLPQAA